MPTLAVPFSDQDVENLGNIGESTGREPAIVVRDWTRERLVALQPGGRAPASRSAAEATSTVPSSIEVLRDRYRPSDVVVLLVGESPPTGGTYFYQADSHLFYATREAFVRAQGPMPDGPEFLDRFRDQGFWLYDLSQRPVNHSRGRPRRDAVNAGVAELASLISELDPDHVVGIKTSLEGPIKAAAQLAEFPAYRLLILPFPLYQWREEYIQGLTRFLRGNDEGSTPEDAPPAPSSGGAMSGHRTLHDAMREVLREAGGGPQPARWVANEIAAQRLYTRRDGARADYQQILARARKYPEYFAVDSHGVRLLD